MANHSSARQLYAEYFGHDRADCIVLLHCLAFDSKVWSRVLGRLPETHAVVTMDLRGHGLSEHHPADDGVTLEDLAADVRSSLDLLGRRSAVLVGVGLGGAVAQAAAYDSPDQVDGLVLVNSTMRDEHASRHWKEFADGLGSDQAGSIDGPDWSMWLGSPQSVTDVELIDRLASTYRRHRRSSVAACATALASANLDPELAGLDVPVAIVAGDADQFTSIEAAELTAETLGARLQILSGVGHLVPIEQPDAIVSAVVAVLKAQA